MKGLRIALFACAYNEIDGVSTTVRHFETYAGNQKFPFLLINGGFNDRDLRAGTMRRVELRRKFPKFALDKKHEFDLLFWRYLDRVTAILREFEPDLVHITGPSDVGMLGAVAAHRLKLPLAASWHTNIHEYAEKRAMRLMRVLPLNLRSVTAAQIREFSLKALARFYRIPRMLFAPNLELLELLQKLTGKECHLMSRGVDTDLFSPKRRSRRTAPFTIGYVGRITAEKDIATLVDLERELLSDGIAGFRFMIVGQGASEPWLKRQLTHADFRGVLCGEQLAEAYANMDAFVFPSRTDTFGNVVLEALASGVPAIVSDAGGPQYIVNHRQTGFIARRRRDFPRFVVDLMKDAPKALAMSIAARNYALGKSWNAVFDCLYKKYEEMLALHCAIPEDLPTIRPDFSTAGVAP